MNFEPQKLFIGLIDFFSILLPGALLTYLLADQVGPCILGTDRFNKLAGVEAGAVFLFTSYLLGHFIFLTGALLDGLYDVIRKATYQEQIRTLAKGGPLSSKLARWLAALLLKGDVDAAVNLAVQIKERHLDQLEASPAINAFQWCKAKLTLESPEAMATIRLQVFS
jgi:hypothetical protein